MVITSQVTSTKAIITLTIFYDDSTFHPFQKYIFSELVDQKVNSSIVNNASRRFSTFISTNSSSTHLNDFEITSMENRSLAVPNLYMEVRIYLLNINRALSGNCGSRDLLGLNLRFEIYVYLRLLLHHRNSLVHHLWQPVLSSYFLQLRNLGCTTDQLANMQMM